MNTIKNENRKLLVMKNENFKIESNIQYSHVIISRYQIPSIIINERKYRKDN